MGKKRQTDEKDVDRKKKKMSGSASLNEWKARFLDSGAMTAELAENLREILESSKDDKSDVAEMSGIMDYQFLVELLVRYGASRCPADVALFDVLCLMERSYNISLAKMQPLLWGTVCRPHYENLKLLGSSLHRPSVNKIFDYLDQSKLWATFRLGDRPDSLLAVYDTRFLLRLFASVLNSGSELKLRDFALKNCLAVVFSVTSSSDINERRLAYYVLHKYAMLAKELSLENFPEQRLFLYLMRLFKESLESETPRLSHMVSHFFARVSKLLFTPDSPLFNALMSSLLLKPQVDMNNVPDLLKLLYSSSSEHYKPEREWMLTLICEAMLEPIDYATLQNKSGISMLLSQFTSCAMDQFSRKLILQVLKSACVMPSVAHDLFIKVNLHSWIASVITTPWLTRWEKNFLAQIFCLLIKNERAFRRERKEDGAFARVSAAIAAKKILAVLTTLSSKEDISIQHLEEISELLGKKWNKKKRRKENKKVQEVEVSN